MVTATSLTHYTAINLGYTPYSSQVPVEQIGLLDTSQSTALSFTQTHRRAAAAAAEATEEGYSHSLSQGHFPNKLSIAVSQSVS